MGRVAEQLDMRGAGSQGSGLTSEFLVMVAR